MNPELLPVYTVYFLLFGDILCKIMKDDDSNPYVHKFSRSFFRSRGDPESSGLKPHERFMGIIMILCIALPIVVIGGVFLYSMFFRR